MILVLLCIIVVFVVVVPAAAVWHERHRVPRRVPRPRPTRPVGSIRRGPWR